MSNGSGCNGLQCSCISNVQRSVLKLVIDFAVQVAMGNLVHSGTGQG